MSKDIEEAVQFYIVESVKYTQLISRNARVLALLTLIITFYCMPDIRILLLLSLYAGLELAQYLVGSIMYKNKFHKLKDDYLVHKIINESHYESLNGFNKPIDVLFYLKLVPLAASIIGLIALLGR